MPRKPVIKPEPVQSFPLGDGILSAIPVEVWDNPADEGGRGAHTKRKRGEAFNLVLEDLQKKLTEQYSTPVRLTLTLKELLGDRTVDTVAKKIVTPVLQTHGITLGATTVWEVANDICKTFQALEMAVKNNADKLQPLERYSPEYYVRKELDEGTFRRKL